ncbi:MAG: ATP-binding protein [Desulfovibrio sp.]
MGAALKIALAYVFFGCLWIAVSDSVLLAIAPSAEVANDWQTYKGWAYVAITGSLVYLMVRGYQHQSDRAYKKLEEHQRRMGLFADTVKDVFWLVDPNTDIPVYVSPAYEKVWGRALLELEEDPLAWTNAVVDDDRKRVIDAIMTSYRKGKSYSYSYRIETPDRGIRWIYERGYPVYDEQGKVEFIAGISSDITRLKRAQDSMVESEKRYRALFEGAGEVIFIFDGQTVVEANTRASKLMNVPMEILLNSTLLDFAPKYQPDGQFSRDVADHYFERVYAGENVLFNWHCIRPDGIAFDLEISMGPIVLEGKLLGQAFIRDVTEQNAMREMMVQSEKMMSVGGLAAGMAHEINNPLGIVLQSAQVLENRLDMKKDRNIESLHNLDIQPEHLGEYLENSSVYKYLDYVNVAGRRTAEIVKNMLRFSRMEESKRSLNNIEDLLDGALEIALNDYDLENKYDFKKIRIQKEYSETLAVMCTETEIIQVFLNLIKNSTQALKGQKSPTIWLRTSMSEGNIVVEIEDNGSGMEQDELRNVFEPFYTTNATGEGSGLGLSVSYFIVTTHHHGKLYARSSVGEGSVFSVVLPLNGFQVEAPLV